MKRGKGFIAYIAVWAFSIFHLCGVNLAQEISHPISPVSNEPAKFTHSAKIYKEKPSVMTGEDALPAEEVCFVVDLAFDNYPDAARVILRTNQYIDYIDYEMENKTKLVLDPMEPLYANLAQTALEKPGLIVSYQLVRSPREKTELPVILKQGFYPIDFLVIEVKRPSTYSVSQRGGLLVIDIGQRSLPKLAEFALSSAIRERLQKSTEEIPQLAEEKTSEVARKPEAARNQIAAAGKKIDAKIIDEIIPKAKSPKGPAEKVKKKAERKGKSVLPIKRPPKEKKIKYEAARKPLPKKAESKEAKPERLTASVSPPKTGLAGILGAEPLSVEPMKVEPEKRPPPLPEKPKAKEDADRTVISEAVAKETAKTKDTTKAEQEALAQPKGLERSVTTPQEEQPIGLAFKHFRDEVLSKAEAMPKMGLPEEKNNLNFEECLQIATYNSLSLTVAEEDIKLNQMKVREAKRALYPAATAKATHTDGETQEVDFREETYGVQLEQPLYYGGRLKLTLKQAQVNREVAQSKYDKEEADVATKVTENFYNLATAQLNLQDQKGLIVESKQIHKLARDKYDLELSTELEFLNVQTQCNQIEYQISVAAKDLEIAKVNLLQAMGVDTSEEIFADFSLDYKERDIDLNECLLLAYQNRPELHMHELLTESSEYEHKIAKSKDDFKADFTGFYGSSGGAYKTEDFDLGDDWYVGVKVAKPWGTHTGSYSYTQNQTSPKLGQSTRTAGTSHSIELGILNNLASLSEKQSAYVNLLKAENELIEIEKTINVEVREAYHNYLKAVFQIKNTKEKIRFREEEVQIIEAQAAVNEAQLSAVLEAKVKLADEKALYHQAIASYKTALANLNKAIGLMGYFK